MAEFDKSLVDQIVRALNATGGEVIEVTSVTPQVNFICRVKPEDEGQWVHGPVERLVKFAFDYKMENAGAEQWKIHACKQYMYRLQKVGGAKYAYGWNLSFRFNIPLEDLMDEVVGCIRGVDDNKKVNITEMDLPFDPTSPANPDARGLLRAGRGMTPVES